MQHPFVDLQFAKTLDLLVPSEKTAGSGESEMSDRMDSEIPDHSWVLDVLTDVGSYVVQHGFTETAEAIAKAEIVATEEMFRNLGIKPV